jgi:hypothetical protein
VLKEIMTRHKICYLLCLLIGATFLCGCDKDEKDVMIRVANRSNVEIGSVLVKFPSQTEMYGHIAPGIATGYRKSSKAYSYAYIEAIVNEKQAVLQPIDYVGERLLSGGHYTYALTYNPDATEIFTRLGLQFEKD